MSVLDGRKVVLFDEAIAGWLLPSLMSARISAEWLVETTRHFLSPPLVILESGRISAAKKRGGTQSLNIDCLRKRGTCHHIHARKGIEDSCTDTSR